MKGAPEIRYAQDSRAIRALAPENILHAFLHLGPEAYEATGDTLRVYARKNSYSDMFNRMDTYLYLLGGISEHKDYKQECNTARTHFFTGTSYLRLSPPLHARCGELQIRLIFPS